MSTGEDDDVKLQRASTSLLSEFDQLLPQLLRKRNHDGSLGQVRMEMREVDMYKACVLVQAISHSTSGQSIDNE